MTSIPPKTLRLHLSLLKRETKSNVKIDRRTTEREKKPIQTFVPILNLNRLNERDLVAKRWHRPTNRSTLCPIGKTNGPRILTAKKCFDACFDWRKKKRKLRNVHRRAYKKVLAHVANVRANIVESMDLKRFEATIWHFYFLFHFCSCSECP